MPTHPVQPPEWIDAAPIQVIESVEIAAPPATVWSHIVDHESWPEWFTDLDRVEPLGRPTGVGGGRRVFAKKLPIDEQFTAWDEHEQFAFAVVRTKVPILHALAESVRLEATDTGTRVTYRQGLQGRTGFGWAVRLIWNRAAKGLGPALQNLRQRVETGER